MVLMSFFSNVNDTNNIFFFSESLLLSWVVTLSFSVELWVSGGRRKEEQGHQCIRVGKLRGRERRIEWSAVTRSMVGRCWIFLEMGWMYSSRV